MDVKLTQLLVNWRNGNQEALDDLIEILSPTLKQMAVNQMFKEGVGHTLQPTALVNEAYIRIYDANVRWQDRSHFLSVVSITMRRILVDHARAKKRDKRNADGLQVTFVESMIHETPCQYDILDLDCALTEFSEFEEVGAKILEMKFFSGMKMQDIADVLEVSLATAERNLKSSRAWLPRRLTG